MSAGAGFTQNLCGGYCFGIRAFLADIDLDGVFAVLGVRVNAVIVGAVCPAGPRIVMGVGTVVDHLVVAFGCGKTGGYDRAKKDQSKEQCEDFFHCFLLL